MKIKDIYKRFGAPPNLGRHMITVCGVALFIKDHWKGSAVDWKTIKEAALLHDLGNIVKFDLEKHVEFLGEEKKRVDYWRKVKTEMLKKYGNDDHKATEKMLGELNIAGKIAAVILNKSFGNSVKISESADWPLKILLYSDLRVSPFGITTLDERLSDIKERLPKYSKRPDFEELLAACREIERQIQEKLDISVSEISDRLIKKNTENLLETEI